jgi:hypothetical protein
VVQHTLTGQTHILQLITQLLLTPIKPPKVKYYVI